MKKPRGVNQKHRRRLEATDPTFGSKVLLKSSVLKLHSCHPPGTSLVPGEQFQRDILPLILVAPRMYIPSISHVWPGVQPSPRLKPVFAQLGPWQAWHLHSSAARSCWPASSSLAALALASGWPTLGAIDLVVLFTFCMNKKYPKFKFDSDHNPSQKRQQLFPKQFTVGVLNSILTGVCLFPGARRRPALRTCPNSFVSRSGWRCPALWTSSLVSIDLFPGGVRLAGCLSYPHVSPSLAGGVWLALSGSLDVFTCVP